MHAMSSRLAIFRDSQRSIFQLTFQYLLLYACHCKNFRPFSLAVSSFAFPPARLISDLGGRLLKRRIIHSGNFSFRYAFFVFPESCFGCWQPRLYHMLFPALFPGCGFLCRLTLQLLCAPEQIMHYSIDFFSLRFAQDVPSDNILGPSFRCWLCSIIPPKVEIDSCALTVRFRSHDAQHAMRPIRWCYEQMGSKIWRTFSFVLLTTSQAAQT